MKKLILAIAIFTAIISSPVLAGPGGGHGGGHGGPSGGHHGGDWVFPFIGGLAVGSFLEYTRPTYVAPSVVYTSPTYVVDTQPVVYIQQQPTSYVTTQPVYQEVLQYVPSCNCYQKTYVPIQP